MKHIVFLIHGMGVNQTDWQKEFIVAIQTAYDKYTDLSSKPIADRFDFVPVSYDQIFRKLVTTWATNAEMIGKLAEETGAPIGVLTNWLKGAGEIGDGNFAWTHAADVLLYRGFRLVREQICAHAAGEMIPRINKQHEEEGRSLWSVVAHSLGTAVAHDTLARIGDPNGTWPGNLAFRAPNEQARLIMMVANVSRVLEVKTPTEPYDAYLSSVKPGFPGQANRGCMYYFTPRHRFDPFTIPSMFHPSEWPDHDSLVVQPPRYLYTEIEHIHDWNVHDFGHYLKHPDVHIPMFRRLLSQEIISDDEARRAHDQFRPFGQLGDEAAIKIRRTLEDQLPAQSQLWSIFGALWKTYHK